MREKGGERVSHSVRQTHPVTKRPIESEREARERNIEGK